MPKIIVEVMPKADLLDPQGKAVNNALHRNGIELHFDRAVTDADLENAKQIAESFLSNSVIEDVVAVTVEN